jgi:hypothetical protein
MIMFFFLRTLFVIDRFSNRSLKYFSTHKTSRSAVHFQIHSHFDVIVFMKLT